MRICSLLTLVALCLIGHQSFLQNGHHPPANGVSNVETAAGAHFEEDANVAAERQRVDSTPLGTDAITLKHLRKVYTGQPEKVMHSGQGDIAKSILQEPHIAVFPACLAFFLQRHSTYCKRARASMHYGIPSDALQYLEVSVQVALHDLCLTVKHGQIMGLLGANGAGKTTTLGMLTRQVLPTAGDAFVHGVSVLQDRSDGQNPASQLGYCPQVDPLLDFMTAEETLRLFARLKGVRKVDVARAVEEVLQRVTITREMSQRICMTYSQGNKRKLALGVALIGGTTAVLLDEPSSGMVSLALQQHSSKPVS